MKLKIILLALLLTTQIKSAVNDFQNVYIVSNSLAISVQPTGTDFAAKGLRADFTNLFDIEIAFSAATVAAQSAAPSTQANFIVKVERTGSTPTVTITDDSNNGSLPADKAL
jgi:hypothetical protein